MAGRSCPKRILYLEYIYRKECPSKIKTIGLLFNKMRNLKVEGNGALLMFHGKMTTIVLDSCQNVTLEGLSVDFERPAGSELHYEYVGENYVDVSVHRDTKYEIVNGKLNLYGEGGNLTKIIVSNMTGKQKPAIIARGGRFYPTYMRKR